MAPVRTKDSKTSSKQPTGRSLGSPSVADGSRPHENSFGLRGDSREKTSRSGDTSAEPHTSSRPYPRGNCRPKRLQLGELQCIRALGAGTYGRVVAARVGKRAEQHPLEESGSVFAVKCFHKRPIRKREQACGGLKEETDMKSVERRSLVELPWNPFVVGILDAYVDPRNLYLLLEFAPCGSLGSYLRKHARKGLSVPHCRVYFAQIVIALEFLQNQGVAHRDLKPDNIMMGADGYLMLADFGSAKRVTSDGDWRVAGTVHYSPPECIKEDTPEEARAYIDWWSAAVTLFEMATGDIPWDRHKSDPPRHAREAIGLRIQKQELIWPQTFKGNNRDLKDLVNRMLRKEISERFGAKIVDRGNGGPAVNLEVRSHRFMLGLPWKAIRDKRILAPWIPESYPDPADGWHHSPMPDQKKIPGLPALNPPVHCRWDDRFCPSKFRTPLPANNAPASGPVVPPIGPPANARNVERGAAHVEVPQAPRPFS